MRPGLRLVSGSFDSDFGESHAPGGKPSNGAKRKTTLLIVEDEVLIRLAVAEFLRESGFRVLEAGNAQEAKLILKSGEPIEIVFSDVNMPGDMNGFELADWIRNAYPDVGVLLTSGVSHVAETRGYGREQGPLLPKPYDHSLLLTHIKRMLLP